MKSMQKEKFPMYQYPYYKVYVDGRRGAVAFCARVVLPDFL
jgi:hypothetical protein